MAVMILAKLTNRCFILGRFKRKRGGLFNCFMW